ncbi:DUF2625 domain-containing protein [Paraflavitalea pollutisoli]|uniref:DUF2625 domain-containing protein n=1 Tax=Paraflavitalea pollutisoli TaxID=3034143 RepID=UPI0023EC7EB5|nr:DUF2625 domain-containing protein [Paraflavitalea sp. H1-2-19X]
MRTFEELLDEKDPAWPQILQWKEAAVNNVELLPADETKAREALYSIQVTTRSLLGAVAYHSGGILIDDGWIRILGSGHPRLPRNLPDWNLGKTFQEYGMRPAWWLVADDAIGGFFAVNGGYFGTDTLGAVYYFGPDTLEWENLDMTYTSFVMFCFQGDVAGFYEGYRWEGWQADVVALPGDQTFMMLPPLWTKEGKNIQTNQRTAIPVEEMYGVSMDFSRQATR